MMQRVIIIPEKEFVGLKNDIIESIHKFSKQGHVFKLVSRDTGKEITNDMEWFGILEYPIECVFKQYLGEVE